MKFFDNDYSKLRLTLDTLKDYIYFMNNDKKNEYTSFHVRQALGLWAMYFILAWVVSYVDSWFATFGFWLFFGVLFIYGFVNAIAGKDQTVPIVGDLFQKWFASLGK